MRPDDIADLYRVDRESYDARREATWVGAVMNLFFVVVIAVALLPGWFLGAFLAWLFPSWLGPVPY